MKTISLTATNIVFDVTLTTTRPAGFQTVAATTLDGRPLLIGMAPSAVYPKARLQADLDAAVAAAMARKAARKARMQYAVPARRIARIYATRRRIARIYAIRTPKAQAPRLAGYKTQRITARVAADKPRMLEVHVTAPADCPQDTVVADFIQAARAAGYTLQAAPEVELFCRRKSGAIRWILKGRVTA